MNKIGFKKGMYDLHEQANFNFQLNRIIMWNGGRLEDIEKIASNIVDSTTWKTELLKIAGEAEMEGRIPNAIGYYRMSEFFMYDGDSDKLRAYQKSCILFYDYYKSYFEDEVVTKHNVPYENVALPAMHMKAKGDKKGTILLHGGNDSYLEELFFSMFYFAEQGYEVYLFEGPGQGGVMRVQGKHFTHEWERPIKVILDYFTLEDVIIIGASLGGYLAPRAAAFETRITKVVAWSVFPSFLEVILSTQANKTRKLMKFLLRIRAKFLINFILSQKMKHGDELLRWGLGHGMYAYEAVTPYDYLCKMNLYQLAPIADKVTQDLLIIGASEDHFIDYRMIGSEINLFTKVRSLTFRLMTKQEFASNHCNLGNTKLALDTIVNWCQMIDQGKEE